MEDDTRVIPPEEQTDAWPGANGHSESKSRSVLDSLKAQRRESAAQRTVDVVVPGWHDRLAIRCGPIPGRQLDRIVERAQSSKSPERTFNGNADTLIAACQVMLGRDSIEDEWVELTDPDDDEPLRLDVRLAARLGLESADRARAVVRALFQYANSPDMALGAAATEYTEWATSANDAADEELLGES